MGPNQKPSLMKFKTIIQILIVLLLGVVLTNQQACKKDNKESKPDGNDTLSIPESTQVISQSDWNTYIVNLDSSDYTLTFNDDILTKQQFEIGEIIVSATPPGYLRKITGISTQNGQLVVTTSFASISDAVENGSFSITEALTPDKILKIDYYTGGVFLDTSEFYKNGNAAMLFNIHEYLDPDQLVLLNGSFDITTTFNCELEIKLFKVKHFEIGFEVGEQLELEAVINLLDIELEPKKVLATVTFNPVYAMIGTVPVTIIPEVEIIAGINFKVESNVSAGFNQQLAYTAKLLYDNNQWSPEHEMTRNLTYQLPELSATAHAKAYVKTQLNLKFYGTVSPFLYGELYERIQADFLSTPLWTLYGGAAASVGVNVDILGANLLDYPIDPPLIQYELELLNSDSAVGNQAPQIPSNSIPQNGSVNIPVNQVLSWQCSDPDGDSLTYDIYFGTSSNPPLITSILAEVTYNPGTLEQNKLYYWKIVANDGHSHTTPGPVWSFTTTEGTGNEAPSLPFDPVPFDGSTDILQDVILQWSCTDPENDPITFNVFFGTTNPPPLVMTNTGAFTYNASGLDINTLYYWKIDASDDQSNITPGSVWSFSTGDGTGENQPPSLPFDPMPANGAMDVLADVTLQWACTDPEDDPMRFDIYFGTTNPPPLVITNSSLFYYETGGLDNNTQYYWKVDAYDDHSNVTPGAIWNFSTQTVGPCPGIPTITYEGQTYNTILIGTQCWMKENLNYVVGNSWCYDNDLSNCDTYGRLYDWETIMNGEVSSNDVPSGVRGICPPGWHIPSNAEWDIIVNYLGGSTVAGGKMKEADYEHWVPPNTDATNSSGFTALPGGRYRFFFGYAALGEMENIWSCTEYNEQFVKYLALNYNSAIAHRSTDNKVNIGLSARCLKD